MNDITGETKGQAKRKNSEWQGPVTSLTPNPNPGRPWNHESTELDEQNFFIFTYNETNKDKLGK